MQITYSFRLYPTIEQENTLFDWLELCRRLYNLVLEERQTAWKTEKISISYYDQQNKLPVFKKDFPEYKVVHSQVLQDVLRRVDTAYKNFFEKRAGYPRFKGKGRYTSITYPQVDKVRHTFSRIDKQLIYLSKIGYVKIHIHREFDYALVGRINIKLKNNQWFANLSCEVPENNHSPQDKFAKVHLKVSNQRKDFLHKISHALVKHNDIIVAEDLEIKNMIRKTRLSKSINDASWGKLLAYIEYKAQKNGKQFVKVPPNGTSQTCICGADVPKDLRVRVHTCPKCGYTDNRDIVSAKVIELRGLQLLAAA